MAVKALDASYVEQCAQIKPSNGVQEQQDLLGDFVGHRRFYLFLAFDQLGNSPNDFVILHGEQLMLEWVRTHLERLGNHTEPNGEQGSRLFEDTTTHKDVAEDRCTKASD